MGRPMLPVPMNPTFISLSLPRLVMRVIASAETRAAPGASWPE